MLSSLFMSFFAKYIAAALIGLALGANVVGQGDDVERRSETEARYSMRLSETGTGLVMMS